MFFWIASVLLLIATIAWIRAAMKRRYEPWISIRFWHTIVGKILTAIGQVAVAFVAWLLLSLIFVGLGNAFQQNYEHVSTEEKSLVALQTRDSVEGSIRNGVFASYGSIDGKRVISYVTKDESGGIRTGTVDADQTVIYEEDSKPRMDVLHWEKRNWLWIDGVISTTETYVIYVPVGSLVENYEVAP
jgi:hypothetical protein